MFAKAIKGGYAIPAYNFNNLEQLQASHSRAAAETKSLYLQVSKVPVLMQTKLCFVHGEGAC